MQVDITKVNGQLFKEVSKIIKEELATAGLHLLELKKAISMVQHDTFITDTAIKIKEAYSKASKEPNAPSTYKKYSMRWGRLISVEKRNEIKVSLNDVSDINALNMAEVDILLGGNTNNRGGGRKSSITEPKEEPSSTPSTPSTPSVQETTEEPKVPVINPRKAKESILNSLNNLLTLDSDSIAFKVSKLSPGDLSNLATALKLLD